MNTILVIDDNESYRANLLEVLNFENYITLEAENGEVGWQLVCEHTPSLIICDVDMPIMTGLDLLKKAKAHALSESIPFVILTGRNDAHTMEMASELGVKQYLTKPINSTQLLITISEILSEN